MAEKKIGNKSFRCDKMSATESSLWLFKLGKALTPMLDKLGDIRKAAQGDATAEEAVLKAIGDLLSGVSAEEAQEILIFFAEKAEVRSPQGIYEPVIFDSTFDGDLASAFQVAAWAIMVNYGDFLAAKMQKP